MLKLFATNNRWKKQAPNIQKEINIIMKRKQSYFEFQTASHVSYNIRFEK